jgi:hypothetical protein
VQFVESLQTLPEGKKEESLLQSFGLGQPSRTLVIGTKEGECKIEVGRETPVAGGVYTRVRSGGQVERIAVVQNQLTEAMDKDLTGWREKRVLPLVVPEVQELLMHQGTLEVEVKKKESGWLITKPVEAPADPTAIQGVLGEISALKAAEFVSDSGGDLALFGLNAPTQSFEVRTKATNRILQIGLTSPKDTNQVFAKVSDQASVFLLPRLAVDGLGKLSDRVRDKRLVTLGQIGEIDGVEMSGKGGEYRLEKSGAGGGWKLVFGKNSFSADGVAPARMGLSKPRQTISLKGSGKTNQLETIQLGDETKEEVFVRGSTTSGAMVVPVSLARGIPESPLGWLPKKVVPADFGPIEGLIWAVGSARKEYRLGADGRWKGDGKETPSLAEYVVRLDQFEVTRWMALSGKAELSKSEVEIVLGGKEGKKLRIFALKGKPEGGAWIRVDGQDWVGVVDRGVVAGLRQDPGGAGEKSPQR